MITETVLGLTAQSTIDRPPTSQPKKSALLCERPFGAAADPRPNEIANPVVGAGGNVPAVGSQPAAAKQSVTSSC
jgi:hypothetical protein